MSLVPYQRRFLFADGPDSLYPQELPRLLFLGQAVASSRQMVLEDDDRSAHVYVCGVSGSGKSRFLENMIIQDIICQRPLCLIDPTAALYRKILEFIAFCTERAERRNHDPTQLLQQYLFLDLDKPSNPLRLNPLEPHPDETTEEQVDDLLKVAERLFGDIDQMRRIRNTLRNTLWVIAELNRLPADRQPPLDGWDYPLNLRFVAEFLTLSTEQRDLLVAALPETELNSYVRTYWTRFFSRYSVSQQQERLESTWNVLQYFLGDSLVSRFFDTRTSTLDVQEVMRRKSSLFCSLPLGKNLKGCQLIGTFLATKFQRAAYRRPASERSPYYLYIDEFHEFADEEFAKAATTLRQYNLRMVNAHQSQSQPPFHTSEGRSILETIKANSQVKVLFRLSREDAETMSKEMFELTQQRPNFTYAEKSVSTASSKTSTRTLSFQKSRSSSLSWSRADAVAIAESDTYGVAKTEGVTVGQTLTEGFGESINETISETITKTESETLTEMRSKAHGISVLIGNNWSHMVNHNTGFTFTRNQNESLAVQRGSSATRTASRQAGLTNTAGRDYKVTDGSGSSFVRTNGSTAFHRRASPSAGRDFKVTDAGGNTFVRTEPALGDAGQSRSNSTALGEVRNHSRSAGKNYSQAIQSLSSVADAIGQSLSTTGTRSSGASQARSSGKTVGTTRGASRQQGITETDTVSQARAKLRGIAHARGTSRSIGKTHQVALAESFQQLEQFSNSYSQAMTETVSRTDSEGLSVEEGVSVGVAEATARSTSEGQVLTEKRTYFSLEGEREITINDLQKLAVRRCVVAKTALAAVEIETYHIPDGYYTYWDRNLPAEILRRQQEKLSPEPIEMDRPEPEPMQLQQDLPENSPWEF